jgi:hypothetical protein|tara:strand:+ start:995 stop:1216 length:222 start_codon:yes stop_codon:yes gene_type:complete
MRDGDTNGDNISDWLEDDEYAIVIKEDGSFQGIFAPFELEDFDQLPETIIVILAMIYGDQLASITPPSGRTMH